MLFNCKKLSPLTKSQREKVTVDKVVLALTGMPGSGKSLVVNITREKGYEIIIMGDVIREETRKRGLAPTPENTGQVMLELRQKEGPATIAKRCLPRIAATKNPKILIDGIRSLDEVAELQNHFPKLTLIALHASPQTRFSRLLKRDRPDDPKNWQTFRERDIRELTVGLGNAIAMAENMIINEGTLETAKQEVRQTIEKVEEKWKK
jgi:dephospho-CoA kinase